MLPSALASLSVVDPANFDASIQTLITWTLEGLDVQSAMAQPDTAFKVRHLKMGIKLSERMLTMYESLTTELLVSQQLCRAHMLLSIHKKLFL